MNLLFLLHLAVSIALIVSVCALTFLVFRTYRVGHNRYLSAPRTGSGKGILYAFTTGMMPWEKESAARHLPTFLAGIVYHVGVFSFFVYLICLLFFPGVRFPILALRIVVAAGAVAGLGLLVKRSIKPQLRALSCPDDFASNALVDACLILALLHTWLPQLETVLLAASLLLFIYMPLGKIRHCFFFFYTRILFGIFFGRRGVYPAPAREK